MTDEQRALLDWVGNNATLVVQGLRAEGSACQEAATSKDISPITFDMFVNAAAQWFSMAAEFDALVDAACD